MSNCDVMIANYVRQTTGKDISDEDKLKIADKIICPKSYLSFEEKYKLVKDVLSETMVLQDGKHIYDSCRKYYCFMCKIIQTYAKIDYTDNMYDKFCSSGLIDYFVILINKEYETLLGMMEMMTEDIESGRMVL